MTDRKTPLIESECREGYFDGLNPDSPYPSSNRHPAYIHGFRNGRDDMLVSKGINRWPSRTAQESRDDWAYIVATEEGQT